MSGPRYDQIKADMLKAEKELEAKNQVQLQQSGQAAETHVVSGSRLSRSTHDDGIGAVVAGKQKHHSRGGRGPAAASASSGAACADKMKKRSAAADAAPPMAAPKHAHGSKKARVSVMSSCASVLGDGLGSTPPQAYPSASQSPEAGSGRSVFAQRVFDDDSELDILSILNGAKLGRSVRAVSLCCCNCAFLFL